MNSSSPLTVISFLGAGRNFPTHYEFAGQTTGPHLFAFAGVGDLFVGEGDVNHIVLATQTASDTNGEAVFAELPNWRDVRIPEGRDESELWQIVKILAEEFPDDGRVIVDITHGFRSVPTLAAAALAYLRLTKPGAAARIERIVYGAFEQKRPLVDSEGVASDAAGRSAQVAPIIDLTMLLTLSDWTSATDAFVRYGQVDGLRALVRKVGIGIDRADPAQRATIEEADKFVNSLGTLENVLATMRTADLAKQAKLALHASYRFVEARNQVIEAAAVPLGATIEVVRDRLRQLKADPLRQPTMVIGLLIDERRYAEVTALLRDLVVARAQETANPVGSTPFDRFAVEDLLNENAGRRRRNEPAGDDVLRLAGEAVTTDVAHQRADRLAEHWDAVTTMRNPIAHAGYTKNSPSLGNHIAMITSKAPLIARFVEEMGTCVDRSRHDDAETGRFGNEDESVPIQTLRNLTSHPVTIEIADGQRLELPPDDPLPLVAEIPVDDWPIAVAGQRIRVVDLHQGKVVNLPGREPGIRRRTSRGGFRRWNAATPCRPRSVSRSSCHELLRPERDREDAAFRRGSAVMNTDASS